MPNITSAKKALRSSERKRVINDRWRRKLRAALKSVRLAIAEGDAKKAKEAAQKTEGILARAARRNIVHPNKAARKASRLHRAADRVGK